MTVSFFRYKKPQPVTVGGALIAAAALALTVWSQYDIGGSEPYFASEWLRDRMVRLQASPQPEKRMVLVDIDESSLAAFGPWPWSRAQLATLLEQLLGNYQARGVALDLVFPERADSAGDTRLSMLAQYGPVVLAHVFDFNGSLPLRVGATAAGLASPAPGAATIASGYIANHAGLARAAHVGNIGLIPDHDGIIRHLPMQAWFAGYDYPTLALALRNCCAAPLRRTAASGPTGGLAGNSGLARVPFDRQLESYQVVSAADILNLAHPANVISGKLVLVGSSSLGLGDRVATPLGPSTSGLLVHAEALSALLDADEGAAAKPWPGRQIAIGYTLLTVLLTAYCFPRLSALANMGLLLAASMAWLLLSYLALPHDAVFSATGPLFSNLFLLAFGVPFAWQMTQKQSIKLLGTLRQYVAVSVVDELLRRRLNDPLAPVRRDVTTLIADMEGYTGHVEALSVEEAAGLTRDFLDCLTRPVLTFGGTLDKFTGDGLVAFWGAPLPVDDHADLALDAAQAIIAEVARYNDRRRQLGLVPLRVRIGIESGVAMAGDFGTSSRSIYTAVGDSVNVASRLETLARDLPHDVIAGPGTAAAARRHQLLCIGDTLLRGKGQRTTLYTLPVPGRAGDGASA